MLEIERKFLVKSGAFKTEAFSLSEIKQGYLNSNPERAVRIRIKKNTGYLTIKGKSDESGTTRFEWEKEIEKEEAEALLKLCEPGVISKIRYEVKAGEHVYEVDEFFDENDGLVLAEIELNTSDEKFIRPNWLGEEVTGDVRYYNSQLSKNPFTLWKEN
ncbi:CYTH domain-containing protein [Leeuwenhoekiella aestuarii]|uniref:CYTH domain-containing protein n=1 Tax=Leeuwenhoekiella aestuarii TaxID=2249426 RepID=A0A4Q0NZN6_9FLAO|nr:CYTH domain-containing protein [Leeuwenhoekiella aestuarii]RXG18055.1 CYTH domain-containing protein [Leeuwenhoekiella aestuarii]RXG19361.1 CYTH domain-containing protein [Leeuwenhoekiella aestuarii]